jgi:hypothetical protein
MHTTHPENLLWLAPVLLIASVICLAFIQTWAATAVFLGVSALTLGLIVVLDKTHVIGHG